MDENENNNIFYEIQKEEKKLQKHLKKLSKEQKEVNKDLVHQLAFMTVTLRDLSNYITKYGVKEEYQNGENQWGYKESIETKTYNNMFKNYQSALKLFNDLLPEDAKEVDGDDLLKFLAKK